MARKKYYSLRKVVSGLPKTQSRGKQRILPQSLQGQLSSHCDARALLSPWSASVLVAEVLNLR
jgi:hypothetical protein